MRSSTSTSAPPRPGETWDGPRCSTSTGPYPPRSPGTRSSSPMAEATQTDVQTLRAEILELVRRYHEVAFTPRTFTPGESPVPCAGRVFDDEELVHLVDSSLDFWLTTGRYADQFER